MAKGVLTAGAHPAGIFADQSIDGPVIGTLIVVLDRGKNLPNRKTIGKQDPYCVARIGKEAKRTESDKRGGQTPKWDKELRFPIRDSPDYRTLKLTCFNEDKKTELIGETTIKLDKILIPGGGADDGWRQLMFKGKYAGEIMVELTFWDLREKKEASELEPKGRRRYDDGDNGGDQEYVSGPRQLAGVGQLAQAKREKEKEKRREKERELKREREKERRGPVRRALPSEPSLPGMEKTEEEKKREAKEKARERRERERERERQAEKDSRERRKERARRDLEEYASEGPDRPRERRRREAYAGDGDYRYEDERRRARRLREREGGASPIPPHRGERGYSPIPPRGDRGYSPIPPADGRGHSPIPPSRGDRGHSRSPIPPPVRGERGHSPIPPRGDRGHSPIPPRGDRGYSPIPPRGDRGHSPIPPRGNRGYSPNPPRSSSYDMYDPQYQDPISAGGYSDQMVMYDEPDDGYHSPLPPPPPPAGLYGNPSANSSFVNLPPLPIDDQPPPPPPPHRHRNTIHGMPSMELRNQPSIGMLPQQPGPLLLKHQPSIQQLPQIPPPLPPQPPTQLPPQIPPPVPPQPPPPPPPQQKLLKHQPSVADWQDESLNRSGSYNSQSSSNFEVIPPAVPIQAQPQPAPVPAAQPKRLPKPRAPSSVYTTAPDFEALSKPDAPYKDDFDDSGRFTAGRPPPPPPPPPSQKQITYDPGYESDTSKSANASALVPAGFNYATGAVEAWKPPFGNRPRTNSDSRAMVIASQQHRPPPPHYSSAANSRRNSFIGDKPIPPSLIPGIDPSLAEALSELERKERLAAVGGDVAGGALTLHQMAQKSLEMGELPGGLEGNGPGSHAGAPPAPYIEEVNDREDGGRRLSAAAAAAKASGAGPAGVSQMVTNKSGPNPTTTNTTNSTSAPSGAGSGDVAIAPKLQPLRYRVKNNYLQQKAIPSSITPEDTTTKTIELTQQVQVNSKNESAQHTANRNSSQQQRQNQSGNGLQPPEVPPQPPSRATNRIEGIPFGPDAYNIVNPKPLKMLAAASSSNNSAGSKSDPTTALTKTSTLAKQSIAKKSSGNKVLGPDDILPPETYAPEPEVKPKSAAQLQAEMEAEMQVQLRKARGINGARDMGTTNVNINMNEISTPYGTPPKMPIAIPDRGPSSRRNTAQLALPPPEDGTPPPPPAHQALTIVSSAAKTAGGTFRHKLQKARPGSKSSKSSGQDSLSVQIAKHEARLAQLELEQKEKEWVEREKREKEQREREREQRAREREQRERETQMQQLQQLQQPVPPRASSNRHSVAIGSGITGNGSGSLANYASNSYNRRSMVALPPPPPGYTDDGMHDGNPDGQDGSAGAMVLHRHRSAEPVYATNPPRPNTGGGWEDQVNNMSRSYSGSNSGAGVYDQGMVLYRPNGGAGNTGYNGGYASYGTAGAGSGYATGAGYAGGGARARGMTVPAPGSSNPSYTHPPSSPAHPHSHQPHNSYSGPNPHYPQQQPPLHQHHQQSQPVNNPQQPQTYPPAGSTAASRSPSINPRRSTDFQTGYASRNGSSTNLAGYNPANNHSNTSLAGYPESVVPLNGYGSGGSGDSVAGGYDDSKALMSHEDWLLSQEMKGISIGVGSTTSGRTGGTVARRGRY